MYGKYPGHRSTWMVVFVTITIAFGTFSTLTFKFSKMSLVSELVIICPDDQHHCLLVFSLKRSFFWLDLSEEIIRWWLRSNNPCMSRHIFSLSFIACCLPLSSFIFFPRPLAPSTHFLCSGCAGLNASLNDKMKITMDDSIQQMQQQWNHYKLVKKSDKQLSELWQKTKEKR